MLVPENDENGRIIDRLETALWRGQIDRRRFVQLAVASGISALTADAVAQDAAAVQQNQRKLAENLKGAYDYIVCGAGSSGSVVARRLAQDTGKQILLLESGGTDDSPSILAPLQCYLMTEASVTGVALIPPLAR